MSKYVTFAGWDDAAHLGEEEKADMAATIPPYLLEAKRNGYPVIGAGAVYPIEEKLISCPNFTPPPEWPVTYALDVGWHSTAVAWFTRSPETKGYSLFDEYKMGKMEPSEHADAIKNAINRPWLQGVVDPAAKGRSQKDGLQLIKIYRELGLRLRPASSSLLGGVKRVWLMLKSGDLKICVGCKEWFKEFRKYRFDKNGNLVQEDDHLLDTTRYFALSGVDLLRFEHKPSEDEQEDYDYAAYAARAGAWMR